MDVQQLELAEQRLSEERTERADDDDVGLGGGDPGARVVGVDVVGLVEVDAEPLRELGDRRRGQLAPAPRPARRAGRVTTSTGRCSLCARRSRTLAAKPDVPR